jgi:hypothetical protein
VNAAPPQPLTVATAWGAAAALPLGALLAATAAGAFFYTRALRAPKAPPVGATVGIAAGALAAAFLAPVLFSSDVYAYAAYGEMARLGLNPYAPAAVTTLDQAVRAAQWQWGGAFPICVYGPAFVALARVVVTSFAPFGLLAQLDALRVLACGAFLLCAPLAYAAYGGDRDAKARAAATVVLNPAAIWCAAEGHNDALALVIVLAGFALVGRRNVTTGAALVALSSLVKLPGIFAALALAITDRRARAGAIAGIAITAAASLPLVAGLTSQLAPHGRYAPAASLQAVLAPLGPAPALLFAFAVAAVLAAASRALLRKSLPEGWIWLGLAGWVLVPNPYPWYGIWLVAVAALAPASRAAGVAIALSLTALLRYVPDAVGAPPPLLGVLLGAAATLPLLWLVQRRAV